MRASPKVSVTVVTYNHERFIGPCLDSILGQQVDFPFEVIVGEDCSTDGTRAIVREYADRHPDVIRPILHPTNGGVNANLAAVFAAATGEYVAHVDGDDLMYPGKLARQAAYMDAHPGMALSFHNMRVFDSESERDLGVFTPPDAPRVQSLDDIVRFGTVYCNSSKMFRRSSRDGMPIDPNTAHIMDWLLHIQSAARGSVGYIDEVLGAYRRHAGATTAADTARPRARLHFDEMVYTVDAARRIGASDDAAAFASDRLHYVMAMRELDWGHPEEFRALIERSATSGGWVNGRHHAFAYRWRRWPRLVRAVTRAYLARRG